MLAYLIGGSFFLLLWVLLYARAPRIRFDMMLSSLGFTHFGPLLQHIYGKDYWNPEYFLATRVGGITIGFDDYVFGFALSGVAAGLFSLVDRTGSNLARRPFFESWLRLQIAGAAFIALTYLLATATGVNSVHVTNALCVVGAVAIIVARPQWIGCSLASGGLMALVLFVFYEAFYLPLYPTIFGQWWHATALSGITLGRVPIEELAWGFAMGLFIGPVVAICRVATGDSRNTSQLRTNAR
jgi:lycopene cyclase-like protein